MEDKTGLRRLCESLKGIRMMYPDMTINALHTFLIASIDEGISMADIAYRANFSQSSCSRNVSLLSAVNRRKAQGLALIEATEDPKERRRKLVHLTVEGKRLASLLRDINKNDS